MITSVDGLSDRVLVVKLGPGEDLLNGIIAACTENNVKNGFVLGAAGSLASAGLFTAAPTKTENGRLVYGYPDEPIHLGGLLGAQMLTAVKGVVCHEADGKVSPHLHYSFTDSDGYAYGGHMAVGNVVLHEVIVTILVIESVDMIRKWDAELNIFVFAPTRLEA